MNYRVKDKETGEEMTLSHTEVNDMVYGDDVQVIVFDTVMEPHLLIDDILLLAQSGCLYYSIDEYNNYVFKLL